MPGILLDLCLASKSDTEENPGSVFNNALKLVRNPKVRRGGSGKASFQEKSLKLSKEKPYRKPTQVVRSSRPRRTSDCSSRNSAKKRP